MEGNHQKMMAQFPEEPAYLIVICLFALITSYTSYNRAEISLLSQVMPNAVIVPNDIDIKHSIDRGKKIFLEKESLGMTVEDIKTKFLYWYEDMKDQYDEEEFDTNLTLILLELEHIDLKMACRKLANRFGMGNAKAILNETINND